MLYTGVRAASRRRGMPGARGHAGGGTFCGVRVRCRQRGRQSCGMPLILERREHPGTFLGVVCPSERDLNPLAHGFSPCRAHVSGPEGVRLNATMEADHPAKRLRVRVAARGIAACSSNVSAPGLWPMVRHKAVLECEAALCYTYGTIPRSS